MQLPPVEFEATPEPILKVPSIPVESVWSIVTARVLKVDVVQELVITDPPIPT